MISVLAVDLASSLLAWVSSDTFQGIIKTLVSAGNYQKAVSINQTGTALSEIIGILGGCALIYLGMDYLRLTLLILAILSALLALPMKIERADDLGRGFKDAFIYIRKMSFILILSLILNGLFISLDVYGSGLMHIVLHSTPIYYTLFLVGFPVGAVLGGALIAAGLLTGDISKFKVTLETFILGELLLAVSVLRLAYIEPVLTLAMGIDVMIINVQLQTFTMRIIPNGIMGRYNSLSVLFSAGASPVMALIFSVLSRFIYFPYVMAGAAVLAILISPFVYFALKSMMHEFSGDHTQNDQES